ncbi:MAG: response regulator [Proteobacteria bacterium]|nr:response regulator [Pseudomonadota bacterium]
MSDPTGSPGAAAPAEFDLLVVDDDPIQRTIIARLGQQAGFKVTAAAGFDEAAGMLDKQVFDCVTLDLGLGERSGALLLPLIAKTGYNLPVLVISGADDHLLEATTLMSKSLQIDARVFAKPLDLSGVRDTLTKLRQQAVTTRALSQMARAAC